MPFWQDSEDTETFLIMATPAVLTRSPVSIRQVRGASELSCPMPTHRSAMNSHAPLT